MILKTKDSIKGVSMSELILFYTASDEGQPTHEHFFASVSRAEMALRNPNRRRFSRAVATSGSWSCDFSESTTSWTDVNEGHISIMQGFVEAVTLGSRGSSFESPYRGHIILFENINFRGKHKHIFMSGDLAPGDVDSTQFDDITSSFVILNGFWRFYRDRNEAPFNVILGPGIYQNVGEIGNSRLGFIEHDSISSIWADILPSETVLQGGNNHIILFEHDNYLGRHKHIFIQELNLNSPDDFTFNDLTSSIWINGGAWELFRHADFIESLQSATRAASIPIFRYSESTFQRIGNNSLSSLRPLPTYGSIARIMHLATGKLLRSLPFVYENPGSSGQQQVTALSGFEENNLWRIKMRDGTRFDENFGHTVENNSIIRLEHLLTHKNLHSHVGIPSAITGQQEVTCFGSFGVGDSNDNWRIETEGGEPLRIGNRFRLFHVNTGQALHSHAHEFMGQQEVTCLSQRDDNDWWVLTESFDRTHNQAILPEDQIVQVLNVNLRMGGEGTDTAPPWRGDPSDVVGYIKLRNGQEISSNFSQNQAWTPFSWHYENIISLPPETRLGDLVVFGIRSIPAGPDWAADNWNMDEIEVKFIGPNTVGILVHQKGSPIHLFLKNSDQSWEQHLESDTMQSGEILYPDHSLVSLNGHFRLTFQTDGNLVLYDNRTGIPTWSSGTGGNAVSVCIMQSDGNLVIYAPGGQAIWSINDWHNPGSRLVVQDDGNVVIYRPDGTVVWATGT
jgi:MIR domain/Beta/Gamma crystallin